MIKFKVPVQFFLCSISVSQFTKGTFEAWESPPKRKIQPKHWRAEKKVRLLDAKFGPHGKIQTSSSIFFCLISVSQFTKGTFEAWESSPKWKIQQKHKRVEKKVRILDAKFGQQRKIQTYSSICLCSISVDQLTAAAFEVCESPPTQKTAKTLTRGERGSTFRR